ncbi:MAG: hypothetical protein WBY44_01700 [Bryobacteraceae bacterium]
MGTIPLVYAHHIRLLQERPTDLQLDYHHAILSTLHIHLDHDNCPEVIVVAGKLADLRSWQTRRSVRKA